MKKLFTLAAVALLTFGAALAQENYQRLQVSYVSYKMTNSEIGDKEITPKGVNLAGVIGVPVSDVQPIYLETGLNMTWAHSAEDFALNSEVKFTYMNAAIPLNGVYKFELNDKVAFSGHAGLNFKVNYMAKQHVNVPGDKESWSMLSKKDMGSRDDRANIFQLGGQVGAGVHLGVLYLGYQFQTDFMKFQQYKAGGDSHKWLANYITLGVTM